MIDIESVTKLMLEHQVLPVALGGHKCLLDGSCVLYWPQQDLLIFSDLHFEKGSFLTQFAHPVPRYDTQETIARMQRMLVRYAPAKVICLGDSFHDGNAVSRMQVEQINALNELVNQCPDWVWVLGNHDPDIPQQIAGKRRSHLNMLNVRFAHEPEQVCDQIYQVVGHFHPKATARLARHSVTGSCFVIGQTLAIMPAFGKYTGGLSVTDDALVRAVNDTTAKHYITYHKKIYLL